MLSLPDYLSKLSYRPQNTYRSTGVFFTKYQYRIFYKIEPVKYIMSESENNEVLDGDQKEYVEDGKNKFPIKCKFCGSKILDKKSGVYLIQEHELPLMQQDNRKEGNIQNETINEFYHVENMYTFENIGFTHTVANYKYLSCADCDAGPVGFHDTDTKHSFVALSRIVHC